MFFIYKKEIFRLLFPYLLKISKICRYFRKFKLGKKINLQIDELFDEVTLIQEKTCFYKKIIIIPPQHN